MTQQKVTFLVARTQFDKDAMLDLTPNHRVGAPDHRICGYFELRSTKANLMEQHALMSIDDKAVWIDDRRNHYRITKVELEQAKIWFVGDLVLTG